MKAILFLLVGVLSLVSSYGQGPKRDVLRKWPWMEKKKLEWKDIRRIATCDSTGPNGASEWGMVSIYYSVTEDATRRKITASTILDLDQSWVCEQIVRNDTFLSYLQVTYDLAELYCRKLNKQYKEIRPTDHEEQELVLLLMQKRFAMEEAYASKRLEFFQETAHGKDVVAIERWKQQLANDLRNEQ